MTTTRWSGTHSIERAQVSVRSRLAERRRTGSTWRDGDLLWLGLLLAGLSAALVIALIWWLVT